jgi:archaeal type IV pilus assembly protein PilA
MDTDRHFSAKIREHKKGISPIIATLLLILIAIAAGVVVYAYVIGFVGNTTGTGTNPIVNEKFSINAWTYNSNNDSMTIFVQNTGSNAINITSAYVYSGTGSLVSDDLSLGYVISPSATVSVVAHVSGVQLNQDYKVEVISANGNVATLTAES